VVSRVHARGADPPFALLVVEGLVVHNVWLGESGSSELLGPGDLISPHEGVDPIVPLRHTWHVANTARLGVLDARVTAIFGAAPNVAARLLARAADQRARASAHWAIVALPRVEDRILALFGYLAERWGRVSPAGLVVPLTLTHEAIGHLVGARRPTVSLGLKTLAEQDRVGRRSDGTWLITTSALDRLRPVEPATAEASALAVVPADDSPLSRGRTRSELAFGAQQREMLRERVDRLTKLHESHVHRAREILERCRAAHETTTALRGRFTRP
jgi:hypothetical protein